jgi:Tfp pilus assembly protein PilW
MKHRLSSAAFTLVETMIAAAAGSIVLTALAVGSVALQRGIAAAEHQVECQEDQLRVLDYISRDLRRATVVTFLNQNRKLVLTLPGQPAALAGGGLPLPTVTDGVVRYGTSNATVTYSIEGTNFLRTENTKSLTLSTRLEEFIASPDRLPLVTLRLTFTPRFSKSAGAASRVAQEVKILTAARNVGGNIQ